MTYPYTLNTGKLPRFLDHIQGTGIPDRLNQAYLAATEFKSSNDRSLIPIMKAIGFVDGSGVPTDRWRAFRDKSRAGTVLGQGVLIAYDDLFKMYPDAHKRPPDTIRNFMASKSNVGEKSLAAMVATFRSLCERAKFEQATDEPDVHGGRSSDQEPSRRLIERSVSRNEASVQINVNLTIEATPDGNVYDAFFAAMRKHLIDVDG